MTNDATATKPPCPICPPLRREIAARMTAMVKELAETIDAESPEFRIDHAGERPHSIVMGLVANILIRRIIADAGGNFFIAMHYLTSLMEESMEVRFIEVQAAPPSLESMDPARLPKA